MIHKFKCALLIGVLYSSALFGQAAAWDSIRAITQPEVTAAFAGQFTTPEIVPLADYGWEDGLQISPDGLHLYALYAPADLLSWVEYFSLNPDLPICETLGTGAYIRDYAGTYGMDMNTNFFGCDTFLNLDILIGSRTNTAEPFTTWTLSDIARPGQIEGGPFPVFNKDDNTLIDHFLFTSVSKVYMINNTTANPTGIGGAVELPYPINPLTNEFTADNPMLFRTDDDALILVYEKYIDPSLRDFMYAISTDDGSTWSTPELITTITNTTGHIEHPMLYDDGHNIWMYFSRNFDIVRKRQNIAGDWDSWTAEEMVIQKGNSVGIGEPSLTKTGDIYFVTVMVNNDNPSDKADADPWFVRNLFPNTITAHNEITIAVEPNPATDKCRIFFSSQETGDLYIYDIQGQCVLQMQNIQQGVSINTHDFTAGMYMINIQLRSGAVMQTKLIKLN